MHPAAARTLTPPLRVAPWLWGARLDGLLFGGSAVLAIGLVGLRRMLAWPAELPAWGFILLVIGIDVAHVYATLFRTYLDREELGRHPWRYTATPIAAYVAGLCLYRASASLFWSVLAYVAVFHFVRQQVGWVALYRARSAFRGPVDRLIDEAATYSATLFPLLYWHAHLESVRFHWFLSGDFVDAAQRLRGVLPAVRGVWAIALGVFAVRQIQLFVRHRVVNPGKCLVVATTAILWYVGIIGTNSDFDFTVTNVIAHGVPYMALTWAYGRARLDLRAPGVRARGLALRIAAVGPAAFLAALLIFAFAEELLWDRLVWLEQPELFGKGAGAGDRTLRWLVPLLALPQATHYALDGVLWRRSETRRNPAQRLALTGSQGRSARTEPPRSSQFVSGSGHPIATFRTRH